MSFQVFLEFVSGFSLELLVCFSPLALASHMNELDEEDEHNSDSVASNHTHDQQPTVRFKLLGLRERAEEKETIHSEKEESVAEIEEVVSAFSERTRKYSKSEGRARSLSA